MAPVRRDRGHPSHRKELDRMITAIAAAPFVWLAWALYRLLADATVRGIRNHTTEEG